MKILRRYLEKDFSGSVKLICQQDEDMWHVFNLVREGDIVRCSTMRKVITETGTGSKNSQRMALTLTIEVESIHFDASHCSLHLKGRNTEEHEHVKRGAYHTLDLELQRHFTLYKQRWDTVDLQRLNLAADPAAGADVAAVVMHEGLANVCLITPSMTVVKAKVETHITRKRKGFSQQHDKSLQQFLKAVTAAFLRHIDMSEQSGIKCILIGSPGCFLGEQFLDHLMQEATRDNMKQITSQRGKFLLVHASSGFKHSLKEVLSEPRVAAKLSDTKAQAEVKALNQFMELMGSQPDRAAYGLKHVRMALAEWGAVDTLMVCDSLFRSRDIGERRTYVGLVDTAKEQGAQVLTFSSMHVSGEQLAQLTGIAAILRYPLHGLDDDQEEDEENEQMDGNGIAADVAMVKQRNGGVSNGINTATSAISDLSMK